MSEFPWQSKDNTVNQVLENLLYLFAEGQSIDNLSNAQLLGRFDCIYNVYFNFANEVHPLMCKQIDELMEMMLFTGIDPQKLPIFKAIKKTEVSA